MMADLEHQIPDSRSAHLANPNTGYNYETVFGGKIPQDFIVYTQMAKEKFELHMPTVLYHSILLPTQQQDAEISSDLSKSGVDDLWGETTSLDLIGEDFQNPHQDINLDATRTTAFSGPAKVQVKVFWEKAEKTLTKAGIQWRRNMGFRFLSSQFAELNLGIHPGDEFVYREARMQVLSYELKGRWKNTDVFLYVDVRAKKS